MVGLRVWDECVRFAARVGGLVTVGLLLASACAAESTSDEDPCPGVCAKAKKCPGAVPVQESCDDHCLGEDALAEESGCHDQYVKSIACLAKLKDVCTGLTACANELAAAQLCEHSYCSAHQKAEVCVNLPL